MLPLNNINGLIPHNEWNDRFQREDERLKTYENWPLEWLDKKVLATIGMFYTGVDDKTKCYFCEVIVDRWNRNDKPEQEHFRLSPNCSLLNRRITNNIPINAETLESVLPKPSSSTCEVMELSYFNSILPSTIVSSSSNTITMFYPEYSKETMRWLSFAEWPRYIKQNPQKLAEAGLFYTGIGDHVQCFSCGLGLKHWEPIDEPWEQHALWMESCSFVKLKKGEAFIKAVLDKFKKTDTAADVLLAYGSDHSAERHKLSTKPELATQNKPQSEDDLMEEKICKICFVNEYNTAFLSCGHVVSCAKCAACVTQCPICRQPFKGVMRLYFT